MQLRSGSRLYSDVVSTSPPSITMTDNTAPASPQVTLISDNVTLPNFSGNGSESVHAFVRRISEECTRRNARTDAERLAILKSRICHDQSSLAGKLVKTDKFLSFTTFDGFTTALVSHFAGHSKLGATHSFLKVAQTITHITRSTADVYKAENIASSLSAELTEQLKSSNWIDADDNIKSDDFKRLISYFLFVLQLDSTTFSVASDIEFVKDDFLYDVCKKITEKSPPTAQPVSIIQQPPQSPAPHHSGHPPHSQTHSPSRSRSKARNQGQHRYYRSRSRTTRNVTCHRCGIKGHVSTNCRVLLDDKGQSNFNPDAYCSFHKKPGHTLSDCRAYNSQQPSYPPSGNEQRSEINHQT